MFHVFLCTLLLKLCSGYKLWSCKGLSRSEPILVKHATQNMNLISPSSIMRSYAHKCGGKTALYCTSSELSTNLLVIQEELTAMRKRISVDIKKPAFIVFTNKARDAIVSEMPQSVEQIDKLTYAGNKILRTVYPDILSITSKFILGDSGTTEEFSVVNNLSKIQLTEKIPEKTAAESEAISAEVDEPIDAESSEISVSSLSLEQRKAAERTLSGQNVFITGSAGTGKSYLLKFIVQESRKKYPPDSIAVTAPTGISAINVGGVTINSFAGYGLGKNIVYLLFIHYRNLTNHTKPLLHFILLF
jgi:transcriptional regulator with PAS, ATPase and Fis domain